MKMLKSEPIFKRVYPLRPTVIRKNDTVKTCYYYNGTKECLASRCFWIKVGKCPTYSRVRARILKAK